VIDLGLQAKPPMENSSRFFVVDMAAADIVLSGQLKPMKTHGTKVTKKATDLFDNSFADNLEKTGFLRELWSGKVP
jgi:hypothetical protein